MLFCICFNVFVLSLSNASWRICKTTLTLFCSTLILANSGLTCDQPVLLPFSFGRRPPTFPEKRSPDSRFFLVRIETTVFLESLSRNVKSWLSRYREIKGFVYVFVYLFYCLPPRSQVWILIIRKWPIFSLLFVFLSLKFPVTHF